MDGKGKWRESVFVERIWKSIKYEEICLHAYASVGKARRKIGCYLELYNSRRLHSRVRAQTPAQVYSHRPPEALAHDEAGCGNAGLMVSAEYNRTVSRPSYKTLKVDECDFHIPTATTTTS